jgi:hypothetical protein
MLFRIIADPEIFTRFEAVHMRRFFQAHNQGRYQASFTQYSILRSLLTAYRDHLFL